MRTQSRKMVVFGRMVALASMALAAHLAEFSALAGDQLPGRLFVRSQQASLKTDKKTDAETVSNLSQGDELKVVSKDGIWFQVEAIRSAKKGWISKLFVSESRPISQNELLTQMSGDANLAKAARRRSNSYTVSASTRGLSPGNRIRDGRETRNVDHQSLELLEKMQANENDISKVIDSK